jgi:hypothetical protein
VGQTIPGLPESPHSFMDREGGCADCHLYYNNYLQEHEFVTYVPDKCHECHAVEDLGRSHPIDIDMSKSRLNINIPDNLPLITDEDFGENIVSCGTCHNVHGEWLSTTKAFPEQKWELVIEEGEEEIFYYKTYFLRLSDPELGFEPLCTSCHQGY